MDASFRNGTALKWDCIVCAVEVQPVDGNTETRNKKTPNQLTLNPLDVRSERVKLNENKTHTQQQQTKREEESILENL